MQMNRIILFIGLILLKGCAPTSKNVSNSSSMIINSSKPNNNPLVIGFNKHSSTQAGLWGASDGIINNSDGNLYVAPRNVNAGNGSYLFIKDLLTEYT